MVGLNDNWGICLGLEEKIFAIYSEKVYNCIIINKNIFKNIYYI